MTPEQERAAFKAFCKSCPDYTPWDAWQARAVLTAEPARNREADRQRFHDPDFNRWLDEGISDAGHTVWDQIGDVCAAWHGWTNHCFYNTPVTAEPASAQAHSLGLLLCELIECEAIGPFTDVMPPALLERWQDACDKHIANTLTYNG